MKEIKQQNVDDAFEQNEVRNVTLIRRAEKEWYFTFEVDDPVTKQPESFAILTQRGALKTWSDPRNLFTYLSERYGVTEGRFKLKEESQDEKQTGPKLVSKDR